LLVSKFSRRGLLAAATLLVSVFGVSGAWSYLRILNRQLTGQRFAEAVRGDWRIEAMHWVLDVNFREDEHPTAERTLANNLG